MSSPDPVDLQLRNAPWRLAVAYAMLAGLWIMLSDRLVASEEWPAWAQTVKGWLFVAVTAIGLYLLIRRLTTQVRSLHAELRRHNDELETRVDQRTAELTEANRDLDMFVHAASHDLRAPIRAVAGFAQALQEDCGDRLNNEGHEHLERILGGAERMDALVLDLRDYNRLGRRVHAEEVVPLDPLVDAVTATFQLEIAATGAAVHRERPLPTVLGDAQTLTRVVQNLVDNALKFVAPGTPPVVRIRAEARGDRTRLWIEDEGIGIAAEHARTIFNPFARLHSSSAYPGSGLGLAIVRRGVERMGGSIGVDSAPGGGSCFWIDLKTAPGAGESS